MAMWLSQTTLIFLWILSATTYNLGIMKYNSFTSLTHEINLLNSSMVIWYDVKLPIKGHKLNYRSSQELIRMVDLSHNNLLGTIPQELFNLTALQSLNLSQNELRGRIFKEVGNLKQLESLDLPNNQLEGEIPQSMSELSFLGFLNLSFNNFTAKSHRQPSFRVLMHLATLAILNYVELHLQRNVQRKKNPTTQKQLKMNFYIGMGVGFATGFWIVCASLFFISSWRHAYFRFLDDLKWKLYVFGAQKTDIFH
ncbi:hypothetical protein L6164_013303 [Bauhinia variegata]|uniref:Uncharacterized protein n=1 Tax=Bauhinia variegata TaxID=167791 RepID=A0ACB9PE47_BAUVA|nr:hypothetical protein L6164_013303 [Bauhinia variegata]